MAKNSETKKYMCIDCKKYLVRIKECPNGVAFWECPECKKQIREELGYTVVCFKCKAEMIEIRCTRMGQCPKCGWRISEPVKEHKVLKPICKYFNPNSGNPLANPNLVRKTELR